MRRHLIAAILGTLSVSSVSAAQSCLGNPSFASGPLNVAVSGSVDGSRVGGGLEGTVGWWGGRLITGVGGSYDVFRNPSETRRRVGVLIGTRRRTEDLLEFCPIVSARYTQGSDFETTTGGTAQARLTSLSAGVGFGAQLSEDRYLSIVPYGIVQLTRVTGTFVGVGDTEDQDVGDTAGVFTFGLGFRFDEWIQVGPTVSVSSFEGADMVVGIRGSMALRVKR